jgi:hypothetical protein
MDRSRFGISDDSTRTACILPFDSRKYLIEAKCGRTLLCPTGIGVPASHMHQHRRRLGSPQRQRTKVKNEHTAYTCLEILPSFSCSPIGAPDRISLTAMKTDEQDLVCFLCSLNTQVSIATTIGDLSVQFPGSLFEQGVHDTTSLWVSDHRPVGTLQ